MGATPVPAVKSVTGEIVSGGSAGPVIVLVVSTRKIVIERASPRSVGTEFPLGLPAGTVGTANEYVWHCHILEHEEHDMMRPLVVIG